MIKKRLLAIAFSCILAVSAIPVMPVWQDAVSVKADEITVEKTEYEGPKKNAPERQTIYHTVDENDKRNGSISLPSDRNTQAVDPSISIYDAKEMLVNSENEAFEKKINPLRGRIGEEVNENLPSAWPAGYEENNELYYHFNTYLPPLRDQGSYGSCWTHGVLGTVESYLINNEGSEDLHGRINRNSNGTLPGINYSELHLAYFSYHNLPNPIIKDQGADFVNLENIGNNTSFLDFGGVDTVGVKTLMNWRGTVDELLLPYTLADELIVSDSEKYAISGIPDEFAYLNDIAHISNAYMINIHENALQVKQAIKENGAVSVSYYSDSDYYDAANNSYFNYKRTIGNHAVCIVGWDDNFPKEKFNTEYSFSPKPQNDGAWLIRNSWIDTLKYPDDDVKLSDKGYFWISYEDLSLSDALVIEAESSDNYDNNYYYTNQVSTEYTETAFDTVANVFTINGIQKAEKEKIDAIVIDTADANVSYSIFICSVDEDGKPDTLNKLCEETTGTIVFPGIYTIPLTDPVTLSRGEKFAVVVSTENGNVASEWALRMGDEKSYLISNCGATPGQSFGYDDEYGWIDYSEYYIGNDGFIGNFYIQVMTSNEGNDSEKRIEGLRVIDRRQKDSLTIGWNSLGDGVKYDIYRALQEDDEYTLIESDYTKTTYIDNNVPKCSVCYYYIVPVIDYEPKTNQESMIISVGVKPVDDVVYSGPVIIDEYYKNNAGEFSMAIGPKKDEADRVVEYRKTGSGNDWTIAEIENALLTENHGPTWGFFEDKLDAPGLYDIRTQATFVNLYGEKYKGAYSYSPNPVMCYYPQPENIKDSYDRETETLVLSWDAVDNPDVDGYNVYLFADEENYTKINDSVVTGPSITLTQVPKDQVLKYAITVNVGKYSDLFSSVEYSYGGRIVVDTYLKKAPTTDDFEILYGEDGTEFFIKWSYDGKVFPALFETELSEEEIGSYTVYYRNANTYAWTTDAPKDAGQYYVALDISGGTKYRAVSKLCNEDDWYMFILPETLYVIPNDLSKEEDDADPVFTYTYTGNIAGEEPGFTGSLTRESGEDVGKYSYLKGSLELTDNGAFKKNNYSLYVSSNGNVFTINQLPSLSAPEVKVKSVTNTTVELQWDSVNKATQYAIYADDEQIATTTRLGCIIRNLTPETEYTFSVYPFRSNKNITGAGEPGTVTVTTNKRAVLTSSEFTFEAPLEPVYDGTAHLATVTPNVDVEVDNIYYKKSDSETWDAEPIDAGEYYVAIDTSETIDYEASDKLTDPSWSFTILPTDKAAPGTPSDTKIVAFSTSKISDVELPQDWEWAEADQDKELTVGRPVSVTAEYTGADKDNYSNISVTITIIRSTCEHENTETVGIKDATCTEDGSAGDLYCNDCDEILEKGAVIEAKGHKYGTPVYTWNEDHTVCTAEVSCTECAEKITEEAVITSEILKEATTDSKGTTRYTATFTNTNVFVAQTADAEDIPMIEETPGEETGNETPGEETGNETPGEETGNETPGEETGNETPGEETGNETPGEETGNETPAENESGNGSSSGESGSGSESSSSGNGNTDSGSSSGGSSSGGSSGGGSSSGGSSSGGSSSGGSSSGGSSGGNVVIVVPTGDNTDTGSNGNTSNTGTNDGKNDDDKEKDGTKTSTGKITNTDGSVTTITTTTDKDDNILMLVTQTVTTAKKSTTTVTTTETPVSNTYEKTVKKTDGSSTSEKIETNLSTNAVTITMSTTDKNGNVDQDIYTVKKASTGNTKKTRGTVTLKKKKKTASKAETVSGTIKTNGKTYAVEAIGAKAFYKNKTIESIVIPATVKAIGKKAFAYCSNLKEIRILGTNITKVWSGAFKKIAPDAVIVIVTDDEKAFNKLAKIIKKSGIGKGVSIVREGTDAQKS